MLLHSSKNLSISGAKSLQRAMTKDGAWEDFMESLKFGYPAASAALCFVGTVANAASFIYFIRKREKSVGDKLLMLLNSIDLLLCISATSLTILFSLLAGDTLMMDTYTNVSHACIAFSILYVILIDGTAYATCLLSVTRGISIAFPFYQIKGKPLIVAGVIVFIIMELTGPVIALIGLANGFSASILRDFVIARIVMTLLMILVVVSATVIAVYKLTKKDLHGAAEQADRNNIKATWTVVILSTLFFVFNSIVLGATAAVLYFINQFEYSLNLTEEELGRLLYLGFSAAFFAIPLNSSLNPIVYLTRRNDMRQYYSKFFKGLFHFRQ
jgi:hypothetical protein